MPYQLYRPEDDPAGPPHTTEDAFADEEPATNESDGFFNSPIPPSPLARVAGGVLAFLAVLVVGIILALVLGVNR